MNLSKNVKFTRLLTSTAAGTGDTLSGAILDMSGFEGVVFVALLGDAAAGAVVTLQAQQNTANSASGMATLAGTAAQAAFSASSGDDKVLVLDVYQPRERYLRPQLVRATTNIAIDGILAIQYEARTRPTVNDATVLSTVLLVSPDEA